jgi:hypothetical protein
MISRRLDSLDAELFSDAIKFFSVALGIGESSTPCTVKTVDNIGRGNVAGSCTAHIDKDNKISNVTIEIKNAITIFGMIEALAHEMVHAEQFVKGKLYFGKEKIYILGIFPSWRRTRFWKGICLNDMDYYSNPAEIEAFLKQRALTLEFFKHVEGKLMPSSVFKHIMQDRNDSAEYCAMLEDESNL